MAISPKTVKKLKELYIDEEIIIYLKDMNVVTVSEEGGEMSINAMIQGFCLDIDTDYIHLGNLEGVVSKSIQHETAGMIEILSRTEELMEFSFPETDNEVH